MNEIQNNIQKYFGDQFLGSNRLDWPSGSKNGSNRVQPYNVLNKLDLNPTSSWVGPSGFKIRLSRVGPRSKFKSNSGRVGRFHLAAQLTKYEFKKVRLKGICITPQYSRRVRGVKLAYQLIELKQLSSLTHFLMLSL